ncbi:MAG: hypothetical protein H6594_12400 [Flavobacteriales bacterium]|nr:hypothetical protein [Flavobacteriales bacterium]
MALVRFHWDFFGPDAVPTAEHFCRHVEEFCDREGITRPRTWTSAFPARCVATLECEEAHVRTVRDALRPKRAERIISH